MPVAVSVLGAASKTGVGDVDGSWLIHSRYRSQSAEACVGYIGAKQAEYNGRYRPIDSLRRRPGCGLIIRGSSSSITGSLVDGFSEGGGFKVLRAGGNMLVELSQDASLGTKSPGRSCNTSISLVFIEDTPNPTCDFQSDSHHRNPHSEKTPSYTAATSTSRTKAQRTPPRTESRFPKP